MFYLSWDFLRAVFGYSQFWKRRSLAFRGKPRITSQIVGLGSVSRDAYYTPEGIKFQNWERKKNTISLSKKPWRTCVRAGNIIQHIPVLGLSFFSYFCCVLSEQMVRASSPLRLFVSFAGREGIEGSIRGAQQKDQTGRSLLSFLEATITAWGSFELDVPRGWSNHWSDIAG